MLDWNYHVGTPLTQNHVSAGQQCDICKLLIAYLALYFDRHLFFTHRRRPSRLIVKCLRGSLGLGLEVRVH
jgi:hypothetical protein